MISCDSGVGFCTTHERQRGPRVWTVWEWWEWGTALPSLLLLYFMSVPFSPHYLTCYCHCHSKLQVYFPHSFIIHPFMWCHYLLSKYISFLLGLCCLSFAFIFCWSSKKCPPFYVFYLPLKPLCVLSQLLLLLSIVIYYLSRKLAYLSCHCHSVIQVWQFHSLWKKKACIFCPPQRNILALQSLLSLQLHSLELFLFML